MRESCLEEGYRQPGKKSPVHIIPTRVSILEIVIN